MKRMPLAATGLALLLVATAFSSRAASTRDEVRAELARARASGELLAPGDSGRTLREQRPDLYPAAPATPAKTRAEVIAELQAAQRAGELTHGDSDRADAELHPGVYPARATPPGRTRAEVRAELAQAQRSGDIAAAGDSGLTLREQNPGRYARAASAPLQVSTAPAASAAR